MPETAKPWIAEYERWKAKRQPRSTEELLREIYSLEHSLEMWRSTARHVGNQIISLTARS